MNNRDAANLPADRVDEMIEKALRVALKSESVEGSIKAILEGLHPSVEYGFWMGFTLGKMATRNQILVLLKAGDQFFDGVEA